MKQLGSDPQIHQEIQETFLRQDMQHSRTFFKIKTKIEGSDRSLFYLDKRKKKLKHLWK